MCYTKLHQFVEKKPCVSVLSLVNVSKFVCFAAWELMHLQELISTSRIHQKSSTSGISLMDMFSLMEKVELYQ